MIFPRFDERMPIAAQNIKWSSENARRYIETFQAIQSGDMEKIKIKLDEQEKSLNAAGLDLGFIYHSKTIISENDQTLSVSPSEYAPTTLPGSRAPHVNLIKNGKTISTLDLFEKEFVLLTGADGELREPENIWHKTYEITTTGAVLIRPDGHVVWRSQTGKDCSEKTLRNIFEKSLCVVTSESRMV